MAISLGSGFFTIRAKDEATQATRQIGEGVRASLGELAQTAVTTMAVAGTAVLGFLGTSVKAFADSERAHAQLEAALKSTAGAAGISAAELDKYAEAAQKTTAYEDDAVTAAQALMLTFTNIGREVFPKAMDAVLDMSTAMGQDLKGSVIQIGKALNDPIQGITALTRVGVSFTDQQKEMIKALVEGGNVAAAQQMILAELAKEFGGSATAEAKTFTGQLKQMWNQFGDLQEEIGGALVPVLKDMMEQLRPILQALADWIEKNPEATTSVLEWAGAIGAVSIALKALMPVFTLVRGGFMLIVDAVVAVAAALELPVIAVVAVVAAIGAAAYAIITNWDAVKAFFEDFWQSLQGIFEIGARNVGELVGWLAQNIVQEFTDPVTFLEELWAGLVDFFSAVWGQIKAVFDWAVTNVFDPVIEKAKELWAWVSKAFGEGFSAGFSGADSGAVPGMAEGGRVGRSGMALVGERGPELLFMPRGAEVLPAQATAALMSGGGGGGISINFNGLVVRQEADIDLITRRMTRELEGVLSRRGMRVRS